MKHKELGPLEAGRFRRQSRDLANTGTIANPRMRSQWAHIFSLGPSFLGCKMGALAPPPCFQWFCGILGRGAADSRRGSWLQELESGRSPARTLEGKLPVSVSRGSNIKDSQKEELRASADFPALRSVTRQSQERTGNELQAGRGEQGQS